MLAVFSELLVGGKGMDLKRADAIAHLLNLATTVVKEVSDDLREVATFDHEIQSKIEGNEVVTAVDERLDRKIREYLLKETGIAVLSEEGGLTTPSTASAVYDEYQWIVDPIDGTTNFSRGVSLFGVSVALQYRDEIVLGVIGIPTENAIYHGIKGNGAFKNGQRIYVSTRATQSPLVFLNNGYSDVAHDRCKVQTQRIDNRFAKRSFGTTAIELCYVAEGKFDGFVCSGDKIWDFAAGILLIREAGGVVTNWKGEPFTLDRDDLICSTELIHEELVSISSDLV